MIDGLRPEAVIAALVVPLLLLGVLVADRLTDRTVLVVICDPSEAVDRKISCGEPELVEVQR